MSSIHNDGPAPRRERLLAGLVESSGDGFFVRDLETGSSWRSARASALLGLPAAEAEVTLDDWVAQVFPEDVPGMVEAWKRIVDGRQEKASREFRARTADGGWAWRRIRAQVSERDARGRVACVTGVISDIQDERAARDALAESQGRLGTVLDTAIDGYFEDDLVRGTRFRSRRTNELLGIPEGETRVDRESWRDIVHPDDVQAVLAATGDLVDGRSVTAEFTVRARMPDGSWRWRLVRMKATRRAADGRPERACGTVVDVHALKQAEEALQRSEARFRALAEGVPVGIFETDGSGGNVYLNPEAERIMGLPTPEARGQGWVAALHPEDRERVAREWGEATRDGRPYASEHRLVRPGGDVSVIRTYSNAIRDREGKVTGFVGVIVDETEHSRIEKRLALASRLGALGTLVAGVGHEINNPLGVMMAGEGHVLEVVRDLLARLRSAAPPDAEAVAAELEETVDALQDGLESGARIAQIVKDLGVFGGSRTSRAVVTLRDVVDAGLRWLPASQGTAVRVEVDGPDVPAVVGTHGQLSQVVHNLVSNACRAGRGGTMPNVTVRIGAGGPGRVTIQVMDDGVGMPPAVVERIFDPFFTTRPAGEGRGAGLGLAICQAIVADHGGTLTVETEPGRGSTFTVDLPRAS